MPSYDTSIRNTRPRRLGDLKIRIGRIRRMDMCHLKWQYNIFKSPDYTEFERNNEIAFYCMANDPDATGLYNPTTKVYVEFTGKYGCETDISHFEHCTEDDIVWEMVYSQNDGCILGLPTKMFFAYWEPFVPCLVHDDIKNGLYLSTWSESFRHRWRCFLGRLFSFPRVAKWSGWAYVREQKEVVWRMFHKEDTASKKKAEQLVPFLTQGPE
ncbi:hypothetical protein TWF481_011038 [Arthrobotrys musiformis]|uniref:Uncharacterized protein n=1 Tax=Arthrobotrys musiformis TaxID=47236 RepID=A0AAV9VX48_9PEZI